MSPRAAIPPPAVRLREALAALALIVAATLALHHTALSGDLLLDDWFNVRSLERPGQAFELFAGNWAFAERGDPLKNVYRPIVRLSFLLDRALWGIDRPGGFHFTNLVLHALNVFFIWGIARSLWASRRHEILVAAIFLVHPLTVESAYWISGRTELWAAVFSLPAIWLTLAMTGEHRGTDFSSRQFWSLPLMALALASKESAAVLPVALLGADLWRQRGWTRLRALWWTATLLVWALYFGLRLWMFGAFLGGANPEAYLDPLRHGRNILAAAALFLNPWVGWTGWGASLAPMVAAAFLLLPAVLCLTARERPFERGILLACFVWGILVVTPYAPGGFSLRSDTRLLYLATAAFTLLSAGLLSLILELALKSRERELEALMVIGLVWAALLGKTTLAVIGDWDQASRIARSSIEAIVLDTLETRAEDIVLIANAPDRFGRAWIFRMIGLQFAVEQTIEERVGEGPLICSVYHLDREAGSGPGLTESRWRLKGTEEPFRPAEVIYRFELHQVGGKSSARVLRGSGDSGWTVVREIPDVPTLNPVPPEYLL